MRYIDLIESKTQLNEGVDLYPSVKSIEDHEGKPYTTFSYPPDSSRQEWQECKYCEGTGHDYYYEEDPNAPAYNPGKKIKKFDPTQKCEPCSPPYGDGNGKTHEWVYDFPMMRVTYMHIDLLCQMLGLPYDDSGSIEPHDLPAAKRRLIMVINTGKADELAKPATDEKGSTRIDRSGDIPRITTGARMIGGGVSSDMVKEGAKRMLEIIEWAQKNGCGVSWA